MPNPHQLVLFKETALDVQAANDAAGHDSAYKARERERFYRSKAWRRLRGFVLARDGARCRECGVTAASARLDCDHIKPISLFPNLALYASNVRVLCEACHERKTYIDGLRQRRSHQSIMREMA